MLLDTSGLLALLDAREPLHQQAREEYGRATGRVTHAFVLAELVAVANSRRVSAGKVLEFLTSLLANPDIETIYPGELLVTQAIARLMARPIRGYSLCDAVSFSLMSARNVAQALTTDQHFEHEGFVRLLK